MSHRVTLLTSQSVARSLTMSHFNTCLDHLGSRSSRYQKVCDTRYYYLMENLKTLANCAEWIRVGNNRKVAKMVLSSLFFLK